MAKRYNALHAKIEGLYKEDKEVVGLGLDYKIDFTWLNKAIEKVRKRFEDAAEVVYESGDMQPEMLRKKKIEALVSEQALILSHDIDIRGGIELTDETKQKFKEDIYVFSGFKTYHELKEASTLLKDSKGNLKDFDTFKKDILSINDKYNVNYLKAEYNHAKRTMEMAGAYERIYSQRNRVNAKYITVGDEKVRMSHRQLDGIIQPIDSPFWETCWPPNGWGCRCDVVAVPKSFEDPTDSADAMFRATSIADGDPMFATNPYRNGCVFPKKHPYYGRKGYGHCKNPKLSHGEKDLECEIYHFIINEYAKNNKEYLEKRREKGFTMQTPDGKKHTYEVDEDGFFTIPVKNAEIKVHIGQTKQELIGNINIAKYMAEKYGYSYSLLPNSSKGKSADAFNHTLNRREEFKTKSILTENSVDNSIKEGIGQANFIIMDISQTKANNEIVGYVKHRMKRSIETHPNFKEVRIIFEDCDYVLNIEGKAVSIKKAG